MKEYEQLCVWPGTLLAGRTPEEFEADMLEVYQVRVKFAEEVYTLPCPEKGEEGGRCDLFFYIHNEDVFKFAVPRLWAGIRWWEDVLENGQGYLYPKEVLEKYPDTWKTSNVKKI